MIPTEKELLEYIKHNDLLNYTAIANHYKIKNSTVSDLITALLHKKLIDVKKIGGSKIVLIKKEA